MVTFWYSFPCRANPLLLEELEGGQSSETSLLSSLIRAPCTCGSTCFPTMFLHHHQSISNPDCPSGSNPGSRDGVLGALASGTRVSVAPVLVKGKVKLLEWRR